jgi:hypothetical protein
LAGNILIVETIIDGSKGLLFFAADGDDTRLVAVLEDGCTCRARTKLIIETRRYLG